MHSINLVEHWLVEVDIDPDLCDIAMAYAQVRGRGGITMTKICSGMDHIYRKVAEEQDTIGWRQFMEGMICHGLRGLQDIYTTVKGSNVDFGVIFRVILGHKLDFCPNFAPVTTSQKHRARHLRVCRLQK
jgi:hypothetical protein